MMNYPLTDQEAKKVNEMADKLIAIARSQRTRTVVQNLVAIILLLLMTAAITLMWFW